MRLLGWIHVGQIRQRGVVRETVGNALVMSLETILWEGEAHRRVELCLCNCFRFCQHACLLSGCCVVGELVLLGIRNEHRAFRGELRWRHIFLERFLGTRLCNNVVLIQNLELLGIRRSTQILWRGMVLNFLILKLVNALFLRKSFFSVFFHIRILLLLVFFNWMDLKWEILDLLSAWLVLLLFRFLRFGLDSEAVSKQLYNLNWGNSKLPSIRESSIPSSSSSTWTAPKY